MLISALKQSHFDYPCMSLHCGLNKGSQVQITSGSKYCRHVQACRCVDNKTLCELTKTESYVHNL